MNENISLKELLQDYYSPLKGISERTFIVYEISLRAFSSFLGHTARLSDLEEVTVARWLSSRQRTRAPATAAKDRAQIRALWEFAARRGMVKTWPSIKRIHVPERVPEAWFTADMQKLIDTATAEPGKISGVPAGLWWKAILLLSYETGERAGGLLSLRWNDVTSDGVVFRAEGRKGGRKDLYSEISQECYEALMALRLQTSGERVFEWDRTYTYLWRRMTVILKRAGLPSDRRCKFHKIRRTTASYYEAAGGSAQQLLGHSSPVVTKRYIDPRIVKKTAACAVIPKVG